MKRLVFDLIQQKGLHAFRSLEPSATIFEALNLLESEKPRALLVVKNQKFVGIFTEKNFLKASFLKGTRLSSTVSSVMTSKVYFALKTFTLEQCLQVMLKLKVNHLPVLDNGSPLALVSMSHILDVLVDEKDAQIRQLTSYITGGAPIEAVSDSFKIVDAPIYYMDRTREAL